MFQAIETHFVGPTNYRGSRVIAKADAGKLVWGWDYRLNPDENHTAAARMLAEKLGWDGVWIGGGRADRKGNVYVRMPRGYTTGEEFKDERDAFKLDKFQVTA